MTKVAALLAEGSSDKALLPILRWLLACTTPQEIRLEWVETAHIARRDASLVEKVRLARIVCPCDVLFVHRDADKAPVQARYQEILNAAFGHLHVAIVPVRMTEAWLLIDEGAIRTASGRVSGTDDLGLPPLARIEAEADPKETLYRALKRAHGATGRRARTFHPPTEVHRLANLIEDWTLLRTLPAFKRLEDETRAALQTLSLPVYPNSL